MSQSPDGLTGSPSGRHRDVARSLMAQHRGHVHVSISPESGRAGMKREVLVAIMVVVVSGCSSPEPQPGNEGQGVVSSIGSTDNRQDTLSSLIDQLRTMQGSFRPVGGGAWEFSGNRRDLDAFQHFGDRAVEKLVACLDRTDRTNTLVQGRLVPLGVLCFEALRYMAYHEAVDSLGDMDADWEGAILPTASFHDLRRARQAWDEVLRTHSHFLYP